MIEFDQRPLNETNPFIYIHIPKTGGKTMWHLFEQQEEQIHVWHNRYFRKLNEPATYITMLRHPVDRVISTYYYIRQYERDPLYSKVKKMSLEQFVGWIQDESVENKRSKTKQDLANIRYRTVNLSTRYLAGGSPDAFHQAKKNLKKYFSFVGVIDYYLESLYMMQRMYGWNFREFTKQNVTKNRPHLSKVDPKLIKVIETYNQHDLMLYRFSKKRFNKQLELLNEQERYEMENWVEQYA
ncbi:sulfotransferase family 2 domain-containing protein [Alkalibacillus silvisoli]|uniref:Sulfotransferase family 2 domain-containing protein n=1 Tax=Alkalibacillus silvisoli TaxID=392823 RepID=A0ABP3JJR1_9BACI